MSNNEHKGNFRLTPLNVAQYHAGFKRFVHNAYTGCIQAMQLELQQADAKKKPFRAKDIWMLY